MITFLDMQYRFARRGINPILISEYVDDGILDGWKGLDRYGNLQNQPSGLWHASYFHKYRGSCSLGYSQEIQPPYPPDYEPDYDIGNNAGDAILEIGHLDEFSAASIKFRHWWETESCQVLALDVMQVYISTDGGITWEWKAQWDSRDDNPPNNPPFWSEVTIPLDPDELVDHLLLRFYFYAGDNLFNDFDGWYIDDIRVEVVR